MLMETREKKVTSMKLGPDGGLSVGLRGSREICCAARAGIQVMRIKVVVVIEKREGSTAGQFLDPLDELVGHRTRALCSGGQCIHRRGGEPEGGGSMASKGME